MRDINPFYFINELKLEFLLSIELLRVRQTCVSDMQHAPWLNCSNFVQECYSVYRHIVLTSRYIWTSWYCVSLGKIDVKSAIKTNADKRHNRSVSE